MGQTIEKTEWRRRSRRAFLTAGATGVLGVLGLTWVYTRSQVGETPWPLRKVLGANEKIWRGIYDPEHGGEFPPAPAPGTMSRQNGDFGLEQEIDLATWKLKVETPGARSLAAAMTLNTLRKMPQTETTELFKCIEGWSEPISYKGVRFSDFLAATGAGTRDGKPWSLGMPHTNLYPYVGLETPDESYYVSVDMPSMLNPKTLLAMEINGAPLADDHGAPLRLIVPVKYGIKSLKRIGRIFFSDEQPRDYWAEEGYDWYAGL